MFFYCQVSSYRGAWQYKSDPSFWATDSTEWHCYLLLGKSSDQHRFWERSEILDFADAADWSTADLQETQCSLQATRLSHCLPLFLVTQNAFWVTRGASEGLSLGQGSLVHSYSCLLTSLKTKQQQKQANKKPKIMRVVIVHFWILWNPVALLCNKSSVERAL